MQAISGFHVNHIFFLLKHRSKRDSSAPQENVCLLPVPFIRTASENCLPIVAFPFMLGASETERAAYCSISFYTRSGGEQSVCAYCIIPLHAWSAREQSAYRTIPFHERSAREQSADCHCPSCGERQKHFQKRLPIVAFAFTQEASACSTAA